MTSNSSPSVSNLVHKLRLQVFSLRSELRHLREEVAEAKRMANDAQVELRALKQSALISLLAPPPPSPAITNVPEDYSELAAEKVVDSLFASIDTAFGKPRGM